MHSSVHFKFQFLRCLFKQETLWQKDAGKNTPSVNLTIKQQDIFYYVVTYLQKHIIDFDQISHQTALFIHPNLCIFITGS